VNYFEIVGLFKLFNHPDIKKYDVLFDKGVSDVFPEFREHKPNVAKILREDLRHGLYHTGVSSGRVYLWHTQVSPAMLYDRSARLLRIDPHKFIPRLRQHLKVYVDRLQDPTEEELRAKFVAAFYVKYGG
jgi:hypothetical protein